MRYILTPLLEGLRSPFVGSKPPDPPVGDAKSKFPERKTSLVNLKSSFFGHKISIPFFPRFKSPFIRNKVPDPSLSKAKSTFPRPSIFKSLKLPFSRNKDPKITTTPVPIPVPIQIPPERQHIPPYNHLVDYEIGYYDNGDALDAFKTSLPNLPKGLRYRERPRVPGFGDPHLLGLPVNVRFRIYQFVTGPVRAKNKMIILSPDRTIDGFWPKKHFMEPRTVFDIIGGLSLSCFQLRHEIMTYYCSQFHFHVTIDYFCSPMVAPLMNKWLPLFANKMQFLTVEVDLTRLGGCYRNEKFALRLGGKRMQWFVKSLVESLSNRSGTIRSLHFMCRRYKGYRPPSQRYIPKNNIADNTEPPKDGTPEDGTPEDGTPEDGTPEDGTPEDGTPEDGTPEDGTQDETQDVSEDATSEARTSLNSSIMVDLLHEKETSNSDESHNDESEKYEPKKDTHYKHVPIKYCSSYTTTVLDFLPRRLGKKGIPVYHLRLSGFGKPYTKHVLRQIGSVGNGLTRLITPKIPPWPRDYPEIHHSITTADGDYLGTIVKFVNPKEEEPVEKPRISRLTASKAFFKRALSRIAFSRTRTTDPETSPPFDYRVLFPDFYDSDEDDESDTASEDEDDPEGVGLGIQLPILPRHPNNKYSLMRMYDIERHIEQKLEEPDFPDPCDEIIEIWAIDSVSKRFGDLFGVSTATRGLPKDRRPPIVVESTHRSIPTLFKGLKRFVSRTPVIPVRMATIPEVDDQLQEINAASSAVNGLFNFPEQRVSATAQNQIQMNGHWNLGQERHGLSHLAQYNSSTNSTFYTNASESTLDMAFSDPTIPALLAPIHDQEVDSSSTLYIPDDGSDTPTMARIRSENLSHADEPWDHMDEQSNHSELELHTVYTSSTYDTDGTRSRSNTEGSVVLDWPLPNFTLPPATTRPPPPVPEAEVGNQLHQIATMPPTRPPPPVPEVGNQLHQIATVSSRRTLRFADEGELHEIPTSSSRRAIRFSDEGQLHQIPTSSSRKTLRFDVPEETDAQQEARRARSDSFRKQRQDEERKHSRGMQSLDSLFNYGVEPVPREPKKPKEPKKQRSRSGSFWGKGKAKNDADDKPSKTPTLRAAKSFPSNFYGREAPDDSWLAPPPNLKEKRSMSRLFHRKKEEPKGAEEVEELSNKINNLFSDPAADIPVDKGTIGRSSRAGGFWKRNKGEAQPDAEDDNAPRPPLRSMRSFSFNPLRLRRRSSTLNTSATELPDELPEELPEELTDDLPNDLSNDLTDEPTNDSSLPPAPAATAPTPEPRARSRGFFNSLRRKTSKLLNADEIDTMSSNLSLLFNGSSATIATNTNESTGGRRSTTTGRESAASGRQSTTAGRESTTSGRDSAASGRQSAASGRQSGTPSGGYSFSRSFGRRAAAAGSIFGPNGGWKDGRGSLANVRWGAGEGMVAPAGLREVREARERRERDEREEREIEEEMERDREIERRELEELRAREREIERRERERRGDRGTLGLGRGPRVAAVEEDDEEEGYVV